MSRTRQTSCINISLFSSLLEMPTAAPDTEPEQLLHRSDAEEGVDLAVDDRQRDAELCGVVRHHDDVMGVRHRVEEPINGDREVGYTKADGAGTAAQFRPGPQVIKDFDARDRSPHSQAEQADVDWAEIGHQASHARVEVGIDY